MHLIPTSQSPGTADHTIYPSGDGRPVAETPVHRRNLFDLIDVLDRRFADEPMVYVSGNMLMYYVLGDKRKHVAPDVFFVRGVPKDKPRDYYLVWEDAAPDLIIELTSASTKSEDLGKKKRLYQDVLGVREYLLFDPRGEYLNPRLQGYRLDNGKYVAIAPLDGRVVSEETGLHFEAQGEDLRVYDPVSQQLLPPALELLALASAERDVAVAERDRILADRERAIAERERAIAERERAVAERERAVAERDRASAENERLRHELAELRRRLGESER